jgi:diketogulonate reductase-like aldo/keto reductase
MMHVSETKFEVIGDEVNPADVPYKTLSSGDKMPAIGLGTFGSDNVSHDEVKASIVGAASVGYRHFDCASVYENEREVGEALQEVMSMGIPREELWITSKLWNDKHAEEDVIGACQQSLADLQVDHLDLYLVHWPFPNFHPPKCDVDSRSPDAKPYIHENYMKTWRQMEKLKEMGLVKNIGTSNVTIPKLKLILRDAKVKPAVNEMEIHPHMQQEELYQYIVNSDIVPVGYCPIGSPARPERDKTPEDTVDIQDPVIVKIAEKHGIHPATLCVKWGQQRGHIPIPMSTKRRNYLANLKSVTTDPLTDEEMREISTIDKNCRLVKGHVFLWEGAKDWKDLWDLDGAIAT